MFKASVTSNQLSQSIISQNWELVGLENFVYPVDGIKPGPFGSSLTKDTYTESGYRVYGQEQVIAGNLSVGDYFISQSKYLQLRIFAIRENDILLSLVGTTGKVLVIRAPFHPGIINPRLIRLRPNPETTNVHYLKHLLESSIVRYQLNQMVQGGTMEVLSATVLRRLRLPKPSLKEQYKIAEILDTIDSTITQTSTLIAKLKQMKAGLLHDLLTRGLDENGELRNAIDRPEQFKDSPLGQIPKDWEVRLLSTIAEVNSGVTLGRQLSGLGTVELPYLRVANVQDGYLDLSDVKTIRVYKEEMPRFSLQAGDVLMNEGGDYDKLGRGTIWYGQISPCLHQNHVFRVRPNQDLILPEFLAAISGSAYGKRFFVLSSKQSTNLASINSTQLKSFPIPCPSILEQKKILDALGAQNTCIQAEETYLNKLKEQKKGLMHDLLTGRVRVTDLKEIPA